MALYEPTGPQMNYTAAELADIESRFAGTSLAGSTQGIEPGPPLTRSVMFDNPRLNKAMREADRAADRIFNKRQAAREAARQMTLPMQFAGSAQPGMRERLIGASGSSFATGAQGPITGPGTQPYAMGRAGMGTSLANQGGGSLANQAAGQVINASSREMPPLGGPRALNAGPQPIQATYARTMGGAAGMADDALLGALNQGGARQTAAGVAQAAGTTSQAVPMAMGATRNAVTSTAAAQATGLRALLAKGMGWKAAAGMGAAGLVGSALVKRAWDDPNAAGDDMLSGILSGAGTGAAGGSILGPKGAIVGGIIGGGLGAWNGLTSSRNEGVAATTGEFDKQNTKLEAQFAELGVPESMRSDLRDQIMMTYTLTEPGKKDDVSAIFDQARASIPALIGQYRDEETAQARSAAIQAIIMPMMQQQQQGYIAESRNTAAQQMAYARQLPPEIAAMQRLQASRIVSDAYGYNQASLGVMGAAAGIEGLIPGAGSQVMQGGEQGAPQLDLTNLIASNRQV